MREPSRDLARQHRVSPYYLSQELVRWADVVVGDYNYYFDSGGALFYRLTVVNDWRVVVLVDEAHNLVDRARSKYSAEQERAEQTLFRRAAAWKTVALSWRRRRYHRQPTIRWLRPVFNRRQADRLIRAAVASEVAADAAGHHVSTLALSHRHYELAATDATG